MRNNKGIGKFEILTLIVLCLLIGAYIMYVIIGKANSQKFVAFKENAVSFSKATSGNRSSFHNLDVVYLDESIDEEFIKKIKSPFSSSYCDGSESKIEVIDNVIYVTLRCDNYLIDKSKLNNLDDVNIYTVSDWYEKQKNVEDEEANVLYNCLDSSGKEIFDKYNEELYFVSRVNKEFNTDYYFSYNIDACEVVSKTMYRTKKIVKQDK